MDFFEYKDFIEGYHGQGFFSMTHIIFMVIATLAIIAIVVCSRKMKPQSLDKYLKVLSIVVPILEVIKIVWESYYDITLGHGFNYVGLLPLYTCSMFIYVLPLAAWCKGKVKDCALAWLGTIGIFAGMTNFYYTQILFTYPFFTYATFMSLNFHFLMVLTGLLIVVSGYKKFKWRDIFKGWLPLFLFSLLVIPLDYALGVDYMLYYHGSGVPVISDLAKYFAEQGARYIYTLIMLAGYALIAAIFVAIYQLCYKCSSKKKKSKSKA